MTFADRLFQFLSAHPSERDTDHPAETCPNCWGHQSWDGQVRELFADKQIDINNHKESHAFIQEFVVQHLDGIRLKKGNDGFSCPHCHARFSNAEGHRH